MTSPRSFALAMLSVATACSTPPVVPAARFANAPPVTAVDDRRDVPTAPEERKFFENLYHYDGTFQRRLTRALELPRARRARGTNALDEVPDSTWFTNRIGVRDLSLDEIRRGPATIDSPELHKPWTIQSTKVGGTEVGFVFKDARGEKFLLKFDPPALPEQETATHVIVGKLLWACGYHTTEDFVVMFSPDDLAIAPGAKIKDQWGDPQGLLDRGALEERLAKIGRAPDGRIRGMASRWLPGRPVGGHPAEGVRDDDPNDRIPHELRRDLRGMYAAFAWLDHDDIQESNFLDMWASDRRDPDRHYLEHYLIDFGKSFGVMSTTSRDPRRGFEYVVDFGDMLRSLFTGGAWLRSWEGREQPALRGIGLFSADGFDPGAWKPDFPSYVPLLTADRFDKFWMAKIMIRLRRDQIRAAVETGRFSDPRATEYLTDVLVARQRATAAYWFARVNPLDGFQMSGDELCFDDLAIVWGVGASASTTRYTLVAYDRVARRITEARVGYAGRRGRTCIAAPLAGGGDGYTILRVITARPEFTGETFVHVAREPATGAPRVIGIWRT